MRIGKSHFVAGAAILGVIAAIWIFQASEPRVRGTFTASAPKPSRSEGTRAAQHADGPSTGSEAPDARPQGDGRPPEEQRAALERAVAAQEKLVEEKRSELARWVRKSAVVSNPSEATVRADPGNPQQGVRTAETYADLKHDYERELRNLERLKSRLDER